MEYSASMVSTLLWWSETQQTAQLLQEGKTIEDIRRLARDENLFNVRSTDRQQRIAGVTYKRVQALPPSMAAYLAAADFRTAKVLVVISVMLTERIFKECCEEVFFPAITDQTFVVTDEAIAAFINRKMTQSPKVAGFSDAALKKLKQTCIKFLYDGGLLGSTKKPRPIVKPIVAGDFLDQCRKNGLLSYYQILMGSTL